MSERTPMEWLDAMCYRDYCGDELGGYDAALAAWEADRARIATLTAQRDALVPLASAFCAFDTGYDSSLDLHDLHSLCQQVLNDVRVAVYYRWYDYPTARAVLAAIEEERETTTEEDNR